MFQGEDRVLFNSSSGTRFIPGKLRFWLGGGKLCWGGGLLDTQHQLPRWSLVGLSAL